jgi:serine protease AprX
MKRLHRRISFGLAIIIAIFAGSGVPMRAGARGPAHRTARLDAALRAVLNDSASGSERIIVRVRPEHRAAVRQSLTAHGDRILAEHDSIDALTAVVHRSDLAELADNDAILSVSSDAIVRPHGLLGGLVGGALGLVGDVITLAVNVILPNGADTSGPIVAPALLRQTLGVDGSTWTGRGIGVAVIDSGLEQSADFQYRVTKFYDFTNGGALERSAFDDYGHGTHVAGIIGGSGAQSSNNSYRGLAPKVKFVILKVLDKTGAGYTSDVVRAIDFAVANKAALGIDIINLSLGHPIFEPAASDPLVQAVERATRAGVIVVAAAGNYGKNPTTGLPGYGGITSPGNAPSAITVGAANIQNTLKRSDDRIPDYSSSGPTWLDAYVKPDVVAPGHNIVAVAAKQGYLYKTYPQLRVDDADYMLLSGTSMASAVATGSIALLVEANRSANGYPQHPSLTPNAVKALLEYTAVGIHDDAGVEYNALRKGAGSINPKGAIDLGRTVDTSTQTGKWWLTTSPYPWTKIGGENLEWGQAILWGTAIAEGNMIGVNETAWSSAILWGTDVAWSSAILWGTNVVWTDPQSWANTIVWGSDSIGYDSGSAILWGTSGSTAETTAWKSLSGSTASTSGQ